MLASKSFPSFLLSKNPLAPFGVRSEVERRDSVGGKYSANQNMENMCACSSVDRALASGARGHRFKSCQAHQVIRSVIRGCSKSSSGKAAGSAGFEMY